MSDAWRKRAEGGASVAEDAMRRGKESFEEFRKSAEGMTNAVVGDVAYFEKLFFSKAKEGVYWAMENKETTSLVGGLTLLIGIPTTRSFLFNLIVRRFRSEESLYRSAERRSGKLKELMELQEKEFQKLEERAVLAAEEMIRGTGKLTAAGAQLRKLRSQASKTETRYTDLLQELRRIPGGQSMALRTQVAETASYAKRQRQAIDKRLSQIIRQGVDV